MTTWDFTADSTSVIKTLRDADPPREQTFNDLSLRMVDTIIYLYEAGQYASAVKFEQIGTIDGVAPTDLQDAFDKILAIIPASGGGGGGISSVNGDTGPNVVLTQSDIPSIAATYVPYTGATNSVELGAYRYYGAGINIFNFFDASNGCYLSADIVSSTQAGLYSSNGDEIIADFERVAKIYTYANGVVQIDLTNQTYTITNLLSTDSFTINGSSVVIQGVDNATATPLSAATLDLVYPNAFIGFRVYCKVITLVYEKTADGTWISQAITIVT